MPGIDARFTVTPYDYAAAERLAATLHVSHVLAQVLVRRGFGDPGEARAFLAAGEAHPLDAFGGLRDAAERILGHVRRRSRITVHGDYDVDGVASTAVLVRALRTLGADVDWYLPSRIDDGYGLAAATVVRLAARGTDLLVTVDCAITAVEEVAAARASGMDVVVTDHHAPRADGRLPDAPIVHPGVGGHPCADLCATGVAYKLAQALLEAAGEDAAAVDEDLDLVALATVADVVPLVGENRRLVREGLRALAGTRKPGLRALMEIARVDPGLLDATAIGFRLAPRINAAGRLHRADAGLELLLTEDPARARAIAAELDAVNTERRDVETRILFAAEAQVAEHGPAAAYVLAAEDWHPGVIGIVAARIAERHHRPTVLISLDGQEGTGSGRSIPAFDLLAGLTAASWHLDRYGGHRAAAGLTIARTAVEGFRERFTAHAAEVLTPDDLVPECRIDAVVPGDALTLGLAEELERLAPFGQGNPAVSLMVPAAELADPRPLGEGRHVAFSLHAGGARSRCVRFGAGSRLPAADGELGRRRRAAGGQPLERRRRATARAPPRAPRRRRRDRRARRAGVRRRARGRARPATSWRPPRSRGADPRSWRPPTASWRPPATSWRPPCAPWRARMTSSPEPVTPAAPGSPACSRTSSPPASPCSPSSPTRRIVRARCAGASAGSPSARGRRSPTSPSWPRRSPISWLSIRPRTLDCWACSNVRPQAREPIWRGVTLSYALPNAYTSGISPCANR